MIRLIALIVFLISSSVYAVSWTHYGTYRSFNPKWEIKNPNAEVPVFRIHVEGRLRGAGCGIESTAFYRLAMMVNKDTIRDLLHHAKSLAFVAGLYTVATYFPVLKEAMVGAEMIADKIASLRNLDCNSAMNIMNHYFKGTSKLVRACVLKKLDPHLNVWTASERDIERAVERRGERVLRQAYEYCMNNASLLDIFPDTSSLSKWLKKNNLRKWVACNYVSAFGLRDLGKKYELRSMLIKGADASTMAKIGLLAITPEWIVDRRTKQLILKPIVDEHGNPINISRIEELIKESVDKEIDELVGYVDRPHPDITTFYAKLKAMNDKFYLDNEKVRPYFDFIVLTLTKIRELESKGEYQKSLDARLMLEDYIENLKKAYYLMKTQSVKNKLYEEYNRLKARKEAEKVGTTGGIDAYCR